MLAPLLLAALASAPSAPAASSSADTRYDHPISIGATTFSYTGFFRATERHYALDLRYLHRLDTLNEARPLLVGGGLRTAGRGGPGWPLELYVRGELQGEFGKCWWTPAAGLEVGYSGYTALSSDRDYRPNDFFAREQQTVSPLYVGFTAAPLRIKVSRFLVSIAEVQLGTTIAPLGAAYRIQLDLVQVGVFL